MRMQSLIFYCDSILDFNCTLLFLSLASFCALMFNLNRSQVYSERGGQVEVLCKPKILPIKSLTLQQLEALNANPDEEEK